MKTFEFTIIASGFDGDTPYEDALFESGCDDATLSVQKGVLIAEFHRAAVSFASAVSSACAAIMTAGLKVERVEPDHLVSLSEIAERGGLSRQAIHLYVKGDRGHGFPHPVAKVTSKHPLWDWCEVADWLCHKNLLGIEEVIQARVVKEANVIVSSTDIDHSTFAHRLELLETA